MGKLNVVRRKCSSSRAKCCATLNERNIFCAQQFLRLRCSQWLSVCFRTKWLRVRFPLQPIWSAFIWWDIGYWITHRPSMRAKICSTLTKKTPSQLTLHKRMKFSNNGFFSKCDQFGRKLFFQEKTEAVATWYSKEKLFWKISPNL